MQDARSNWMEGYLCMSVYLIIAVAVSSNTFRNSLLERDLRLCQIFYPMILAYLRFDWCQSVLGECVTVWLLRFYCDTDHSALCPLSHPSIAVLSKRRYSRSSLTCMLDCARLSTNMTKRGSRLYMSCVVQALRPITCNEIDLLGISIIHDLKQICPLYRMKSTFVSSITRP